MVNHSCLAKPSTSNPKVVVRQQHNVWEIRVRVRVRFGVRFRVMVRFRVRVRVWLVLGLIILGTLSRYYSAHGIT